MTDDFKPADLAELKREFNTVPHRRSRSDAPCPRCGAPLDERDRVGGGVSCFDVTTLYSCDRCGYYTIGEMQWWTDY